MEALWRDYYYGRKLGLTLKELATSLPSTSNPGHQLSIPSIRDNVTKLSELSLISQDAVVRGRGRPSEIVRLNVLNVITWPTTAAIVLRLFNKPGSMLSKELFVQDTLAVGLIDYDGNSQSIELIVRQIDFATSSGYIGTVPAHENVLTTLDRAWQENEYLQFVSSQKRPPAS